MDDCKVPGSLPPAIHLELLRHLGGTRSTLSASEAIGRAVQQWIAREKEQAEVAQGYQWKSVFLPSASLVRLRHGGESHVAIVCGDQLKYQGIAVSPRQFTLLVAGPGRNAWRDLWVRLPGVRDWVPAAKLRRQREEKSEAARSPLDTMAVAARSMSDALQAALTMAEHYRHGAFLAGEQASERRLSRQRRKADLLGEAGDFG